MKRYRVEITDRQWEILEFIKGYIKDNGVSPSHSDICNCFGFRPNAAQWFIDSLEKKGFIKSLRAANGRRVARGIKVL